MKTSSTSFLQRNNHDINFLAGLPITNLFGFAVPRDDNLTASASLMKARDVKCSKRISLKLSLMNFIYSVPAWLRGFVFAPNAAVCEKCNQSIAKNNISLTKNHSRRWVSEEKASRWKRASIKITAKAGSREWNGISNIKIKSRTHSLGFSSFLSDRGLQEKGFRSLSCWECGWNRKEDVRVV